MNRECKLPNRMASKSTMVYCTKCRLVNYCSRECQEADWPGHKPTCKIIEDREAAFAMKEKVIASMKDFMDFGKAVCGAAASSKSISNSSGNEGSGDDSDSSDDDGFPAPSTPHLDQVCKSENERNEFLDQMSSMLLRMAKKSEIESKAKELDKRMAALKPKEGEEMDKEAGEEWERKVKKILAELRELRQELDALEAGNGI